MIKRFGSFLLLLAVLGVDAQAGCSQRRVLKNKIVQYTFEVKVGNQPEDKIRVHRVIRESRPGVPSAAKDGVFLVHGDTFGFNEVFLAGLNTNQESYAIYLAEQGIDVWGLDRRWVAVQPTTTDFGFMRNWNVKTEITDIAAALTLARSIRLVTGGGLEKLTLNGWSSGAFLTYAYANAEAAVPPALRHVKAMVPMDILYKLGPDAEVERQKACAREQAFKAQYDSGVSHFDGGTIPALIGNLAASAPTQPSPLAPGLNNYQAAMFLGGFIYQLDPTFDVVPVFHQTAAEVNAMGIPTGLRFTDENHFIRFLTTARPYMNLGTRVDIESTVCNQTPVKYDDNLAKIKIPTLYVGAAGGFGEYGSYTQSLLGSTDKTNLIIRNSPSDPRIFEYGHSDILLASDAKTKVWAPIKQWVLAH